MWEVFLAFLRLGCTAFGGPIAHLGYFREEFVARRRWLDEAGFAQLVALCSVLPGPTSSQVGILIGLTRAGIGGAFAAWLAFTTPSAAILTVVALALRGSESGGNVNPVLAGALAGLGLAAAGVVALAVLTLAQTLCVDRPTKTVAIAATIVAALLAPFPQWQWSPIALGAIAGLVLMRDAPQISATPLRLPWARAGGAVALALFAIIIVVLTVARPGDPRLDLIATIVRAGSLVFGGGHVVLPLLQSLVTEHLVSARDFFAGYAAAQAVPGPLFTFAAFLGTENTSGLSGVPGGIAGTLAIFFPSFVLLAGVVPFWNGIRTWPGSAPALRGANAAVVGLLAAVLYNPIFTGLLTSAPRFAIATFAFGLLAVWKVPPWVVVLVCGALGAALLRG